MLKILNTDQIKAWDAYTIKHEPIASIDLMERACKAFVNWFLEKFDATKKVAVVCGTGNNGGDGLGIARMLHEWGYPVKVWVIKGAVIESEDFIINRERLPDKIEVIEIQSKPDPDIFKPFDILIDGIFGSGLSREVEGIYSEVIECINRSRLIRVAIDIPSGLFADKHSSGNCVKSDYTVTFQIPKLAFLLPENQEKVGVWKVVDIGLSKNFAQEVECNYFLLDKKSIVKRIPSRKKFSHKGDFGKALIVSGSYGKMGACVLACQAAMRSGLGLLTTHIPKSGYTIIQTSVPEAMVTVDENEFIISRIELEKEFEAIGFGPGVGTDPLTMAALRELLEKAICPLVIDADGLNILSEHRELLHLVPKHSILTPHPGELARLVGTWDNDFDKLDRTKKMAKELNAIIVLKGAYSCIFTPEGRIYFNNTGNPGMATGGSGDVLTGIITSLRAQNLSALDAAVAGVFVHGLAGDLAAYAKGYAGMIASDIILYLPEAFKQLK